MAVSLEGLVLGFEVGLLKPVSGLAARVGLDCCVNELLQGHPVLRERHLQGSTYGQQRRSDEGQQDLGLTCCSCLFLGDLLHHFFEQVVELFLGFHVMLDALGIDALLHGQLVVLSGCRVCLYH